MIAHKVCHNSSTLNKISIHSIITKGRECELDKFRLDPRKDILTYHPKVISGPLAPCQVWMVMLLKPAGPGRMALARPLSLGQPRGCIS
jgi:hypothetical protein